jgi:Holliday junction resolvase RusA-like endonuclease
MEMSIFFPVKVPSKKNNKQIFRLPNGNPFITSSRSHKTWHAGMIAGLKQLKVDTLGDATFTECAVSIELYDRRKHRYDLSNKAETLLDALVDAGILLDDNRRVVTSLTIQDLTPDACEDGWYVFIDGKTGIAP